MNIRQAKQQVEYAVRAYLARDEYGDYVIPVESQRPIFLMGPPGIGKTAIMAQIAEEMDIALVSYSMTHHTRQSALGLPFIEEKEYGGKTYHVSEYTMSEIIASMYDVMEETGKTEGILFLDEINCISETLAPSMLQFLQYKTFGRHRVPDGWVVVTAGNPPEYNDSVRDFDLVTWDRLKRIDVEPDFRVWRAYAGNKGVHPLILSYLENRKEDFYSIQTTVDGKSFVTARGWVDLSDMMILLEKQGVPVDEALISQYIQDRAIAKNFSAYYDLFRKYQQEYRISDILAGKNIDEAAERAGQAAFDERITLLGLLTHAAEEDLREIYETGKALRGVVGGIREKTEEFAAATAGEAAELASEMIADCERRLQKAQAGRAISREEIRIRKEEIAILTDLRRRLREGEREADPVSVIRNVTGERHADLQNRAESGGAKLSHLFDFVLKAFGEGNELLILVTDLTENRYSADFIARYGCEEYYKYNKELMFYERQSDLSRQIDELGLTDNE